MPDAFVRPARVSDAPTVARLQLETWRTAYAGLVPAPVLDGLDPAAVAGAWHAAIAAPPTPRHRVLVALERDETVGFAAYGPADADDLADPHDPTGPADDGGPAEDDAARTPAGTGPPADPHRTVAVGPLLVLPRWGRRGHGSRLLAAVVDLARADGFTTAVTWVLDADRSSAAFFAAAGWEPDGTGRILDMAGTDVPETRLVTSLATT